MKRKKNKYKIVKELPNEAMKVSDYAKDVRDCNTSYLYQLIREGKNHDFEIVEFKGINFIIPN
jgi:hypothetical protein